ncbi:MAG: FAD-dependent oxidoreductase [Steroidobacteraceae bacterium]
MPWSRRKFLAATATTIAAARVAKAARAAPYDVAVIGAGLSGLHTAMLLSELGAKVVVLEATGRVGGRCLTMDRWHLQPDLGGVQIGAFYARVLDVAGRLGVALGPGAHVNAGYSFVVNDSLVSASEWPDSPLNRTEGAERSVPPHALGGFFVERRSPFATSDAWLDDNAAAYDLSLADWLTRQGASPDARRIIRVSQGRPLESLSVLRMFQEATRGKLGSTIVDPKLLEGKDFYQRASLLSQHVVGGTSRLTEAMAASLGERVQLNKPVVAIDLRKDHCEIRCSDRSRVRSRFAVAAVPFSVLRRIAISPALQGDQADAVSRMPYGTQSQIWLRTREPYWEKDGIDASMWTDGAFNLIRQQIEPDGTRELLSALAFSDNALRVDAMSPAERGRFAIAEIERIRPSTRGLLEFVGAHSWELEPYQHGCSFQMVPGRASAWVRSMSQPHLALHFAGEHTRRLEIGMEAAMESGERAALEIASRMD